MVRKRLWMGSAVFAAMAVVGAGALALGSGGSSLVSNSVPTSQLASSTSSSTRPPKVMHHGFMMGLKPGLVYSKSVLAVKGGGFKTIIGVRGVLTAISSTSISVKRADTGAIVSASISSTTKFGRTTEAALASDLSSGKTVRVMMVETNGTAKLIALLPPPITKPAANGEVPMQSSVSSNSSSSSGSGVISSTTSP